MIRTLNGIIYLTRILLSLFTGEPVTDGQPPSYEHVTGQVYTISHPPSSHTNTQTRSQVMSLTSHLQVSHMEQTSISLRRECCSYMSPPPIDRTTPPAYLDACGFYHAGRTSDSGTVHTHGLPKLEPLPPSYHSMFP